MVHKEKLLEILHLHKDYGNGPVLKDVSLDIQKGEVVVLIGPSGCGKSTFLRCMNGLEQIQSGEIRLDGNVITDSKTKWSDMRQKIGMVFQSYELFPHMTVIDNILLGPLKVQKKDKKEAEKEAEGLLKRVGLLEKKNAFPRELSGGQKQRVAIARVLAGNPEILLCDEATSALDPQTTKSILALLKEINQKYGITIVVITHEMSVVQEICNYVAVLDQGRMVESGKVEELFRSPKTEAARKLILHAGSQIKRMNGKRLIRITYSGQSAFEPVIGNAVLLYKTPLNILYADTKNLNGKAEGEMILQLPEDASAADKMVQYFREEKLCVEELEYVG